MSLKSEKRSLRLPKDLDDKISNAARSENRSYNAMVEELLRRALKMR